MRQAKKEEVGKNQPPLETTFFYVYLANLNTHKLPP
jgi:hypothetical protein